MKSRGFTLLETMIYIALLSIIMGGVLASVYQILSGSSATSSRNTVQEEGTFVIRKIDWAMSGAKTFTLPHTYELSVTRYDGSTVDIILSGGVIQMSENGGTLRAITTSNVSVSGLAFSTVGSAPQGVVASTTISGLNFGTTRYLSQ